MWTDFFSANFFYFFFKVRLSTKYLQCLKRHIPVHITPHCDFFLQIKHDSWNCLWTSKTVQVFLFLEQYNNHNIRGYIHCAFLIASRIHCRSCASWATLHLRHSVCFVTMRHLHFKWHASGFRCPFGVVRALLSWLNKTRPKRMHVNVSVGSVQGANHTFRDDALQ